MEKTKENSNRKSGIQKENENHLKIFFMTYVFDLAHASSMELIGVKEDRHFLVAQSENGRRVHITSVDKVHEKKQERKLKRV